MLSKLSRRSVGYLEGVVSAVLNSVLFSVKYFFGVMYNSVAVVADSIHTLSDSLTSMVVIVGFWIRDKPADEEHPFGHGRAEAIATVVIGSMLIMVGLDFLQKSYSKIVSRESLVYSLQLVVVLALSAVAKEALALWAFRLAKRVNAPSIRADAWHHRSDAIAAALIAAAIYFGSSFWWLDGLLGFITSALIIYTGAVIVLERATELLGRALSRDEVEKLKELVRSVNPRISDIHHIHVHKYGDHVEISLHIRLDPTMSLHEAHTIASNVEKRIREVLGWEPTIHVEPSPA